MPHALLSVSDKTNLQPFARKLSGLGYTLLSTGGTFKAITAGGIPATELSAFTGHPEMLDGRVKTLHPKVHAGLLHRRDAPEHLDAMKSAGYEAIDVVVVNLYPFESTVSKMDCSLEDAIENIDIGGPTMLRSAAKNHASVYVVVDPADYDRVIEAIEAKDEQKAFSLRQELALKVFRHTAAYDAAISAYLGQQWQPEEPFSNKLTLSWNKHLPLRYGENPHQQAAFYALPRRDGVISFAAMQQHQGKELSFNNLLDLDAALRIVLDVADPCAVVIKHTNPTGVATREHLVDAYITARDVDPEAAFGSIMAFNREVDETTATELAKTFIEAVVAPGYSAGALEILGDKKKHQRIRLLDYSGLTEVSPALDVKTVAGGVLVQMPDTVLFGDDVRSVGGAEPTPQQQKDLDLAWAVVKHVKSNAIVLAQNGATVGTGAGQMSRVAALDNALKISGDRAKGAVLASDAFFPFRDSIDLAHRHGVTAIIQPGGSIRDEEVIAAAQEHGMAMLLTGMRHFKH